MQNFIYFIFLYLYFRFCKYYILKKFIIILLFKIKKDKINIINYLSLLSFIFINIFFYRIAEHGTDRSAQILIFLLIIEY